MIRLKKLLKESQPPKDKILDIDGSLPYVTVVYQETVNGSNGERVSIEFNDYDLEDQVDDYVWHGFLTGTDSIGATWRVEVEAVELGGGDYDWEVDWDTIEKQ